MKEGVIVTKGKRKYYNMKKKSWKTWSVIHVCRVKVANRPTCQNATSPRGHFSRKRGGAGANLHNQLVTHVPVTHCVYWETKIPRVPWMWHLLTNDWYKLKKFFLFLIRWLAIEVNRRYEASIGDSWIRKQSFQGSKGFRSSKLSERSVLDSLPVTFNVNFMASFRSHAAAPCFQSITAGQKVKKLRSLDF